MSVRPVSRLVTPQAAAPATRKTSVASKAAKVILTAAAVTAAVYGIQLAAAHVVRAFNAARIAVPVVAAAAPEVVAPVVAAAAPEVVAPVVAAAAPEVVAPVAAAAAPEVVAAAPGRLTQAYDAVNKVLAGHPKTIAAGAVALVAVKALHLPSRLAAAFMPPIIF